MRPRCLVGILPRCLGPVLNLCRVLRPRVWLLLAIRQQQRDAGIFFAAKAASAGPRLRMVRVNPRLNHRPVSFQTLAQRALANQGHQPCLWIMAVSPAPDGFETMYDYKPSIAHRGHIFWEYGLLELHTARRNSDTAVAF